MGYQKNKTMQVPVNDEANLIVRQKGFNYYVVDLRSANRQRITKIIAGLEAVERDTWVAQEDFWEYIKKSDFVAYAEQNGKIVGFNLVSIMLKDEYCIYTIDEAMVLRSYQGNNLARNVVAVAMWWFMKNGWCTDITKKFVLVSTSSNPKVVNNYFKNGYIVKIFDNSFNPSEELIALHHEYLKKYGYELVNPDYPFALREMFPGSNQFEKYEVIPQYMDGVRDKMPPEYDYVKRGDAWSFMVAASMQAFVLVTIAVCMAFLGFKALFNDKIGLLKRKSSDTMLEPAAEVGRVSKNMAS
ncbi:MAG: GNAT family N-acetyltransferase [Ignavibacteriales bacterium]